MFKRFFTRFTLAVALLMQVSFPAHTAGFDPVGQDIDIFLANPSFTASRPNILILLDNTANWSSAFENEKAALIATFGLLDASFNVGLMMFTETGGGNTGTDGGYVRFAVRQMTDPNKAALNSIISGLDVMADKSNGAKYSLLMAEAYRYYAGIQADAGKNKAKADYTGNTTYLNSDVANTKNALSAIGATNYNSPIVESCQKNFIILISNGAAGDNASDLGRVQTLLSTISGASSPAVIPISPSGEQNLWVDELAKFMAENDCNATVAGAQKVITYTVDVDPKTTGQNPGHTAMLESAATNGKGSYFAVSSGNGGAQIKDALGKIFNEVQAVNSAFVSATLPVSVNVRGTNINQVYIGLFRPDSDKKPRWAGNMKLYKLALNASNGNLFTADANGVDIFSSTTGFVKNSASSFWTTGSTFWSFKGPSYAPTDIGKQSDLPDGDIVEKGGAAQLLRSTYATSQTARKVYTCATPCVAGALTNFDTANTAITSTSLGTYPTQAVTSLSSSGTTATATVPAHGFVNGNTVTISQATPDGYNGDFVIAGVTTDTFTYTLSAAASAGGGTLATLNKVAGHGLVTGDLITITGASPAEYNVTDLPLTKVSASNATFALPSAASSSATLGTITIKKPVAALVQIGNTVTANVPAHSYPVGQSFTISGALPASANGTFIVTSVAAGNDSFKYTNPTAVSATALTAYAIISSHPFVDGSSVTIAGATPAAFNGTFVVTKIDADTIGYTLASAQTGNATGAITASYNSVLTVTALSRANPNGNSAAAILGRKTATATTSAAHGLAVNGSVTIAGATPSQFNGTFTVASVPSATTFTYVTATEAGSVTATGTITATRASTSAVITLGTYAGATGSIKSATTFSGGTVTVQSIATGLIRAGRKADADSTARDNLINWVRGTDNAENENGVGLTDARSSIHGDVLHSKPQVVNYNRDGTDNDVYVFYGSNDGVFRAVKGGFDTTTGGTENWSFVAPEFYGRLKRLRDNSPLLAVDAPKDYFFDGPIAVYTYDANGDGKLKAADGDKVYIYLSMRRGGRYIYALDVSDPDAPKFMWRRGCPNLDNDTGCDAGFLRIGQTWAEPQVGFVRAFPSTPMLFVAGGYDSKAEDIQPCLVTLNDSDEVRAKLGGVPVFTSAGTCTTSDNTVTTISRSKGNRIFVINALTGALVWRAGNNASTISGVVSADISGMKYSIAADLFVLNRDGDNSRTITAGAKENIGRGFVDRFYAADTGGNIWRADIDPTALADWTVRKLASVSGSALNEKRKFLYKIDAIAGKDSIGPFDAIVIGSGDREHPFDATVTNEVYMFKDRIQDIPALNATAPSTITVSDLYDATANDIQQASASTQATAAAALDAAKGWRVTLAAGEKVTTNVVTVAGESFFNTNQPAPSASVEDGTCESNLGIARLYNISFADATAVRDLNSTTTLTKEDRSQIKAGGGFAPPPVQVVVSIDGKLKEAVVTFPVPTTVTGPSRDARLRTYWKRKLD